MNTKRLPTQFAATASGFTATITTDSLDRDYEVVIPQGMDATEYLKNPILIWNHNPDLPIGKCVGLKRTERAIVGDFVFAQRPEGYAGDYFPEFVASLVGQGIVKGISIGYMAAQGGTRRATPDDRRRYGDGLHTVYSKWRLMEVSVAPVQANPDALVNAIQKGAVCARGAAKWLDWKPTPAAVPAPAAPAPVRHSVVVTVPARTWADASRKAAAPIDVSEITRRELRREKGLLR